MRYVNRVDKRVWIRKIALVCLLIFPSFTSFCQQHRYALQITHLTGSLYVYVSYGSYGGEHYPANAMYMVTKKGVVLFDTPWDKEYFQALLDSIWVRHHKKVIMCISTHFHDDRTAGLEYYASRGIKTYTTRLTDSLSAVNHNSRARFFIPFDTTFEVGGDAFQIYYPDPGHTRDNLVVWFPRQKVLYGGCLIKSVDDKSLGNLEDADVDEWDSSLLRLQRKFPDPSYIIVGHHDWRNNHSIQHTLQLVYDYKKGKK